jgi:hypothetical protein
MIQQLWKFCSHYYLYQLQQRNKWKDTQPNITNSDLVILKEDNLPPLVWKTAVIIEIHTGKDGLTRVVSLRTAKGTLKHPISKISLLPNID